MADGISRDVSMKFEALGDGRMASFADGYMQDNGTAFGLNHSSFFLPSKHIFTLRVCARVQLSAKSVKL